MLEPLQKPLLVIITGPTATGKSELSVQIAQAFDAEIIGADSRQFFREMNIGTARPDHTLTEAVKHHFVGHLSVNELYNAGRYESDVLDFLETYFKQKSLAILTGGSGLYIKAVCEGFDAIPDICADSRNKAEAFFSAHGLEELQQKTHSIDPETFEKIDIQNPRRLLRILEVYYETGEKLSTFRGKDKPKRPFEILKITLNTERKSLYNRINRRVDKMIDAGLIDEVKALEDYWNHPNLNTVGYKELIAYFRGEMSYEMAVSEIKKNSRRYAKRQLTWLRKEQNMHWFEPEGKAAVIALIKDKLSVK